VVPVAAKVRRLQRDDDDMTGARRDVLVAAGAQVGLGRLEGLDPTHFDLGVEPPRSAGRHPRNAQATSSATTTRAATTIT
jgi:hypothetical protein